VKNDEICWIVGQRLKRRRRILDLTLRQVADRCGLTFQQIQKYEAGRVDMSIARLVALTAILRMPLSELLAGLEWRDAEADVRLDRRHGDHPIVDAQRLSASF
jgi:transcriptional regulator with XRE-family HTH domain